MDRTSKIAIATIELIASTGILAGLLLLNDELLLIGIVAAIVRVMIALANPRDASFVDRYVSAGASAVKWVLGTIFIAAVTACAGLLLAGRWIVNTLKTRTLALVDAVATAMPLRPNEPRCGTPGSARRAALERAAVKECAEIERAARAAIKRRPKPVLESVSFEFDAGSAWVYRATLTMAPCTKLRALGCTVVQAQTRIPATELADTKMGLDELLFAVYSKAADQVVKHWGETAEKHKASKKQA